MFDFFECHPPKVVPNTLSTGSPSKRLTFPDCSSHAHIGPSISTRTESKRLPLLEDRLPSIHLGPGFAGVIDNRFACRRDICKLSMHRHAAIAVRPSSWRQDVVFSGLSVAPLPIGWVALTGRKCRWRSSVQAIKSICLFSTCNIRDRNHGKAQGRCIRIL